MKSLENLMTFFYDFFSLPILKALHSNLKYFSASDFIIVQASKSREAIGALNGTPCAPVWESLL